MVILLAVLLIALLLFGVPIFVALNLAVLVIMMIFTDMSPMIMIQKAFAGVDKFALMSMPFFIFAANVMVVGGLADRILRFTRSIVGRVSGGLAYTTEASCMVFGALSGSSPATVIAMGKVLYPEMVRQNYPEAFSLGLITSSGSVALLIPPSITMIIYATTTGVSVGELFMAGIGAGLVYGFATLVYIFIYSKRHTLPKDAKASMREILIATRDTAWSLMVPVIILGGIYLGVMTPTEAAGVSAVYAIFVGMFVYKELSFKKLLEVSRDSAVTCAQVLVLVAAAQAFGWFLTVARVPQTISTALLENINSAWLFLVLINIILLIVGMFMEGIAAIIILGPLFYPIAVDLGIDPVHLGVIMVANLAIGNFTPPFGLNLFVATGITGMKMAKLVPAVMVYVVVNIIALLIITYIPEVSMFIPNLAYK